MLYNQNAKTAQCVRLGRLAGKGSAMAQKKKSKKQTGALTKLILVVLFVALGYQIFTLQQQVQQARQQEDELAAQITQQMQINDAIASDIARADDPELLAQLAREELDMVYDNEKVFVDSSKSNG